MGILHFFVTLSAPGSLLQGPKCVESVEYSILDYKKLDYIILYYTIQKIRSQYTTIYYTILIDYLLYHTNIL